MPREIKFRGRRLDNGEWVYGNLIEGNRIVGNTTDWNNEYFCTEFWYTVYPETVGQYTGDKNRGFEGDIIEWVEPNRSEHGDIIDYEFLRGVVEWDNERSGFIVRCLNGNEWFEGIMNITIIGNIHDNPELLEAPE